MNVKFGRPQPSRLLRTRVSVKVFFYFNRVFINNKTIRDLTLTDMHVTTIRLARHVINYNGFFFLFFRLLTFVLE